MDERGKSMQTAVAGATLALAGVLIGVIGCASGFYHSHHTIESNRSPTPDELAVGVGISIVSSIVGVTVTLVGASILAWALVRRGRSNKSPD